MFYTTEHYRYSLPTAQMAFSMLGDDFPIEEMIVSNIRTDLKSLVSTKKIKIAL